MFTQRKTSILPVTSWASVLHSSSSKSSPPQRSRAHSCLARTSSSRLQARDGLTRRQSSRNAEEGVSSSPNVFEFVTFSLNGSVARQNLQPSRRRQRASPLPSTSLQIGKLSHHQCLNVGCCRLLTRKHHVRNSKILVTLHRFHEILYFTLPLSWRS